ncbi:MAG: GntR family transcriptional regulator [Coriobacteriales bacterium]|nr:GntR family transcriptional regulator [Coriobacteriales bacterium]
MFLSIEPGSDVPLYLQLRNQIVDALVRGELVEGDRLPSVRQLAVDLGINLHTVNKAYKALEREGYLRIQGRRGA